MKGKTAGIEFLTGYLVEKSLSIDNVFIFAIIFKHFSAPLKYQHRILVYGVLSAIVLRGIFIFAGVELVKHFEWIFYIFGGFLIVTAFKMVTETENSSDLSDNKILLIIRRFVPVTSDFHQQKFLVKIQGIRISCNT